MTKTHRIEILNDAHVGMMGRLAHEATLRLGGDMATAQRTATVASELAANLAKHGRGGEILLSESKSGPDCKIDLHALDKGPGIENVAACLKRGQSSTGLGVRGLRLVNELAQEFQVYTRSGQGTAVWARCHISGTVYPSEIFDHGGISVAVRGEELCGDAWVIAELSDELRIILADGLGHGLLAALAARKAIAIFQSSLQSGLSACLTKIHQELYNTRGAAASLISLNWAAGEIIMAGVGNVAVRILAADTTKAFLGDNGTLGAGIRKITEFKQSWDKDSVLVLHSDGISSRWETAGYPRLMAAHPALIAGVLYRDFRHLHDDSSVVVLRQRRPAAEGA